MDKNDPNINKIVFSDYLIQKKIGKGSFGTVYSGIIISTNQKIAFKLEKRKGDFPGMLETEACRLYLLQGEGIPKIICYGNNRTDNILIQELLGNSLEELFNNYGKKFSLKTVCNIGIQLMKRIRHIHKKYHIHRDIKPDNFMTGRGENEKNIYIIDFGLATTSSKDTKSVGTPYYMSPETIEGHSYVKSDIWSVGVIVYLMLTGKYAFQAEKGEDLYKKIKNDEIDMKPLIESKCTQEAIDFIQKCLKKNHLERMNTTECLEHPWIAKFCMKNNSNLLNNDTVDTLLEFANKNALQKEIYYFLAKISTENDINKLKEFFNQLDVDSSGTLTIEEVEKAFKEIDINITEAELQQIWEGLDFHKDGQVNYSEFLAAMVSSYNFQKEEKLWSVFNLFKEGNKGKNYITYDSLCSAAKALNLNINEDEIKKCFEEYDEEINFETFKKLILEPELEDKNFRENCTDRKEIRRRSTRRNSRLSMKNK